MPHRLPLRAKRPRKQAPVDPVADAIVHARHGSLPGVADIAPPSLIDETSAAVQRIVKDKGGAPEIYQYFKQRGVVPDRGAVEDALANMKHGVPGRIPIKPAPPSLDETTMSRSALSQGLRDTGNFIAGNVGSALDNIPLLD